MASQTQPQLFGILIDSTRERRAPLRFLALQIAITVHVLALGVVLAESWLDIPAIHEPHPKPLPVPFPTPPPDKQEPDKVERKVERKTEDKIGVTLPDTGTELSAIPDTTFVGRLVEADSSTSDHTGHWDNVELNPEPQPPVVIVRIKSPVPPEVMLDVRPKYPPLAEASHVEGTVILKVVILRDGTVGEITVLRGLPMGLTEAALDAVRRRRYKPATTEDGESAEIECTVTVNFRL